MTSQAAVLHTTAVSSPIVKIIRPKPRNKRQDITEPERIPMLRMRAEGGRKQGTNRTHSSSSGNSLLGGQRSKVECPSMDSGVSNRYRSTESEGSSPASCLQHLRELDALLEAEYHNIENPSKPTSHNGGVIPKYVVTNTKERYKTTASDRDADMEVSEILSCSSPGTSAMWQSISDDETGYDVTNDDICDVSPFRGSKSSNNMSSSKNNQLRQRREVGALLRNKDRSNFSRRHNTNTKNVRVIEDVRTNGPITSCALGQGNKKSPVLISSGPGSSRGNSALSLSDIGENNDVTTTSRTHNHHTVPIDQLTKSTSSIEANAGVSSNDTHRSSVRYEPVVTDHSCTPPSPGRHNSRHKLLGNSKHRSSRMTDEDITDDERNDDDVREGEVDDDIASMDDVIRSEELRPLNSRRRMSSPVIEQHVRDQYGGRQSSQFLARTNSGTVYVTKGPTTLPNEPRQTGIPRMGTGLPLSSPGAGTQSTVPIGATTSMYKPPTSIVTSRLPSSQTDQFDPVVMTTIKPTHEADQSGWNYMGGSDVRNQYPFSGGAAAVPRHSVTTPSGDDTAARFMSKRPSLANAYTANRHIPNSQFEPSAFKSFKSKVSSGCSWRCVALLFIVICVLLLALVGYFFVQTLSTSEPIESSKAECLEQTGNPGSSTGASGRGNEDPFEIQIGRKTRFVIPPGNFWRSLVFMSDDSHLKFNFSITRRAVLAIYGRKGIQPSHTKYDFFERLDGASVPVTTADMSSKRRKRDTISNDVTLSFVQFMDSGSWYVGVYNDGEDAQEVEINTALAEDLASCPNNCNGNGDCVKGVCKCFPRFQGLDCSEAPCLPSCHPDHGTCLSGTCQCNEGWTGQTCDQRMCNSRCYKHGTCSNGRCICHMGWNGETCSLNGCPDDCGENGHCTRGASGAWSCSCNQGWKGESCQVPVELMCSDGKDNDRDTLIDCHDPDCCSNARCRNSKECQGASDPANILSRTVGRPQQTSTMPFYNRVRFLIQPSSNIQSVSTSSVFEPKEITVLRGKIVTQDGSPIVGVRVRVQGRSEFGFTVSRSNGWYDIMVNGGGSVTLQFTRPMLLPATTTTFAPLKDYVILPTITMRTSSQPEQLVSDVTVGNCDVSVFPRPRVMILPSNVQAFTADNCEDRGPVIPETQAIRESVNLPFSGVNLVYLSSRTSGYKSKLEIQLTASEVASNLQMVHLRISIQGVLYEKVFEPIAELVHSFVWDRMNAYGENVYGTVSAKVEVGYKYEMCPSVVWDSHLTQIEGHDPMMTQSIGGWSLSIHHTYHSGQGVVHLGNGGAMRLDRQPPMMSTLMGTGSQRHSSCDGCTGPASSMKLLAPVSLACDAKGNVFVGDYNYIRKIDEHGQVSSLLYLRNPPHKYYIAASPKAEGTLYYSDPIGKRVYRVRNMNPQPRGSRRILSAADLSTNMEVVAGTGDSCLPLIGGKCGDNGPAHNAKLSGPRGIAVDVHGRVYFVDGAMIRVVEPNGIIKTFAGSYNMGASRPLPCEGTISLSQLQLDFPTDLSINPFDGSLYILDTNIVVRVDVINQQASLVAGVPIHCTRKAARSPDQRDSRKVPLVSPAGIVISPRDGSLFISESDNEFVNRVRRVDTYRLRISTVAGANSGCDCQMSDCNCFTGDGDFARSARLNTPSSLAASPNGSIYIADQLNMRIRKISPTIPEANSRGKYRIANPDTNHVYVFSNDGLHLTTQNVITGTTVYNFTYTPDGLLNSIIDVNGNRLSVIHDSNAVPYKLLLPNKKVLQLQFNAQKSLQGVLEDYSFPLATFTYNDDESTLLRSVTHGRSASSFFVYDVYGRLVSAVSPSGSRTTLHAQLNETTHTVTMATVATSIGNVEDNDRGVGARAVVIMTQPGFICDVVTTKEGEMTATYKRWTDNSISVHFLDGSELSLETKPHPVLGLTAPFLAKRTIHLPNDPLENNIEWRMRKQLESASSKDERYLLGRRMRVNGRNILSLDYSQNLKMEKIYDDHTKFVLKIQYNDRGMPTLWMPSNGITPVNVTYDRPGHPATWQRGGNHEIMRYDEDGRVKSRTTADGAVWSYVNQDNVVQLTIPGTSSRYTFVFDEFENIRRITLPQGGVFTVTRFVGVGFRRIQIENPAGTIKKTIDYDDKNNILLQSYEGEGRKVVYRYDTHGHMTEVLHDKEKTRMLRDPSSGELVSVMTDDVITRFHRNGPLVQKLTLTSQTQRQREEISAKFEFNHDVNLRLKSSRAMINDTNLQPETIQYDDVSGKVTMFGPYSVLYYRANMYVISTSEVTYTKEHDHNGRPEQVSLDIYRNPFFLLSVRYDVMGRVTNQNYRIGLYSNETQISYQYRTDGSLSNVNVRNAQGWKYLYDNDGKLTSIQRGRSITRIRYNTHGRVTARGPLQYTFDEDGFLKFRGNEIFDYDSLAHLVSAYTKDSLYKLKYGYDGFGRLSSRYDEKTRQILRFYYAEINNPTRVTHAFNSSSGLIYTLRYDMEGNLFAIDLSNGHSWSVMCDNNGSPLVVFSSSGVVLKQMKYSPFGELISDSNSNIHLIIGYRGGIYDRDTGLVHFADRTSIQQLRKFGNRKNVDLSGFLEGVDYDPLIAQTTTPDYTILVNKREKVVQPFKPYQVLDPVNPVPPYDQMTHVSNWLDALGFKLQNVAPDPKIDDRQKDKSSVECQLSHHLQTYINLQTVSPSSLVTQNVGKTKNIPNGALFAQGLVMSIDKGTISTHVTSTTTNDVKRLSSVINGGDVIIGKNADSPSAAMSMTSQGKPIIYISKPLGSLKADKVTLKLSDSKRILDGGNSGVIPGSTSSQTNMIKVMLTDDVIMAESPNCIVSISYVSKTGKTRASEEDRIVEIARNQAENNAWTIEKEKLEPGQKTRWNVREKQELRTRGKVSGYKVQFFWDFDKYPEFAGSGRNVNFVRT